MSIVSVEEMRNSPDMSFGLDDDRTYTRTFIVISDDKNDGPIIVTTDPSIPRHFDVYAFGNERDNGSVVVDIDQERDIDNPLKWIVTVSYDSKDKAVTKQRNRDKAPRDFDEDGVPDNMEIRYGTEVREKAAVRDVLTKKAIKNSAGDLFDPPPVAPDPVLVINITRDEAEDTFSADNVEKFIKKTNKKPFFGFPEGTCLMDDINSDRQFQNNTFFWRVNYQVKVRNDEDKWQAVLLQYGPNKLVNSTKVRIKDTEGHPIMGRLSTAGVLLAEASTDVYGRFTIFDSKDFGELQIDEQNAGI